MSPDPTPEEARLEALERVRQRCLLTRRIVPFLVHQQVDRGASVAEVAARLGLPEADVRAYVREIEEAMGRAGPAPGSPQAEEAGSSTRA
jgi:hypothetical protein